MTNMIFQYITVAIIIVIVIFYVVSKVKSFKKRNSSDATPCSCCSLKEQCAPDKSKELKKCDQNIAKSKENN